MVEQELEKFRNSFRSDVISLYQPVFYALEGGKKIRPTLVLMSAEAFGGNLDEALIPAVAVEMFHNFTLIHDDIMDNSPLRRGRETVQKKWGLNQALLSGDALLILVYQRLQQLDNRKFDRILPLFNTTALQVCEGQQLDMEFETSQNVSIDDYLKMIRLKTAVLIAMSLAIGAIIANARDKDVDLIYEYGLNLGLSFQIQDDYLDAFGNQDVFGKKIGNDILTKKKTFLLISALDKADKHTGDKILNLINDEYLNDEEKIKNVIEIYKSLKINDLAKERILDFYAAALKSLEKITGLTDEKKKVFKDFADYLIKREF